jgi:hypothetical protein
MFALIAFVGSTLVLLAAGLYLSIATGQDVADQVADAAGGSKPSLS